MKIEIYGQPQFAVPFTRRLTEALIICADVHYDAHCKSQSRNGQLRRIIDFMNGLAIDNHSYTMSFRELDTLMKVCENYPDHLLTAPQKHDIREFVIVGMQAMSQANTLSTEWNGVVGQ